MKKFINLWLPILSATTTIAIGLTAILTHRDTALATLLIIQSITIIALIIARWTRHYDYACACEEADQHLADYTRLRKRLLILHGISKEETRFSKLYGDQATVEVAEWYDKEISKLLKEN